MENEKKEEKKKRRGKDGEKKRLTVYGLRYTVL
jgi:hypothetical protein